MNNTITVQKKDPREGVLDTKSTESLAIQEQEVKPEFDIDGFLAMRIEFITKVNKIMVKGSDYHEIQGKKSLAKGGAEKIASIFGWTAAFVKDSDTLEAFGNTPGLVAYVCELSKGTAVVGQGRGAASLDKNAKDPNKTIKMAQKSAFIDAVLRASGLSDFFTQDLEDHPEHLNPQYQFKIYRPYEGDSYIPEVEDGGVIVKKVYPPSAKQLEFVQNLLDQKRLDEEWMIEQGYGKISDLTGGKDGTCSELIEFLKHYIPETSVTTDTYNRTKEGKEMEEKLKQAKDPAELMELKAQLGTMKRQFTKSDLEALKEVYLKAESEIMPQE